MPLHDWKDDRGWDSVHLVWLAQLLDWVQPRLPAGYRAFSHNKRQGSLVRMHPISLSGG